MPKRGGNAKRRRSPRIDEERKEGVNKFEHETFGFKKRSLRSQPWKKKNGT